MSEKMTEIYVAKSPAIASRMLGGEMMIMSALDSTFFILNPVASVIWQAADGHTPLSQIVVRHVCNEFEVDARTALRDAERFVTELSGHGVLLLSDRPFPNCSAVPTEAA